MTFFTPNMRSDSWAGTRQFGWGTSRFDYRSHCKEIVCIIDSAIAGVGFWGAMTSLPAAATGISRASVRALATRGTASAGSVATNTADDVIGLADDYIAPPSSFVRTEALSGRASTRTVSELAESMRTGGWQGEPIKVVEHNGHNLIVDGHHRVAAARIAGIDVPYKVVDPSTVIGPGSDNPRRRPRS